MGWGRDGGDLGHCGLGSLGGATGQIAEGSADLVENLYRCKIDG